MNFFAASFLAALTTLSASAAPSSEELETMGRRVWQNECAGTRDGLTSWNAGENFASLGIGHFIWYHAGARGPFEESFPKLLKFLSENGAHVPGWLSAQTDCPWTSRADFQRDFKSDRMNGLRDLLASTLRLQSRFLAQRMEDALPKMLAEAPTTKRELLKNNFLRLAATGTGTFALVDYVNFKGEGTNPSERYQGEGWGLLQVLLAMAPDGKPTRAFAQAASHVLERRVRNAPPQRGESRWLPGWKSRVAAYAN